MIFSISRLAGGTPCAIYYINISQVSCGLFGRSNYKKKKIEDRTVLCVSPLLFYCDLPASVANKRA